MGRIFGTDGVRGIANGDLTIELAMNIGRAAAMVVERACGQRPTFLLGKDTRISSDMLESAIAAGLCSAGAQVLCLGVVPTPAVAYLITKYGAQAGIMLSASHNPYEYNGIKIFNGEGFKLRDEQEDEIERIVLDGELPYEIKPASDIGTVAHVQRAAEDYIEHLTSTVKGDLSGLRVAIDCANGSASVTAKKLFCGLGADCDIFHNEPDGINVNWRCGSTHVQELGKLVRQGHYDCGLAFDGDADRCLAVDENGEIVDGDRLLAMFAYHLKEQGKLLNNTLVVTVMSNLGLFKFAERHGINTRATAVGDRYVLECMLAEDFCIGGEQSGHIIFRDYMTTGDGQLSGIQLLSLLKSWGKPLSEAAGLMKTYPQTLLNIKATPKMKAALQTSYHIQHTIKKQNEAMAGEGRILVRASGTEPLIRIMVEGKELAQIEAVAQQIAQAITAE
ncbi:MAG: phosphoglucosamine mutase [Anaerotruncus sp.]|nr:phosphoglucosamine mutase [Anaerotruncus sp.]